MFEDENISADEEDLTEHAGSKVSHRRKKSLDSPSVHAAILTSDDVNFDCHNERFEAGITRTRIPDRSNSYLSLFNLLSSMESTHDELVVHLPDRYDAGSIKSVLTWFGRICLAGVGMFVEAFIVITTGQIKTVWRKQYPECWIPDEDQLCPGNIECCCLFPNTPDALEPIATTCEASGEHFDSVICTETSIHSVSYAEFAGIMAGMLVFGFCSDRVGRKNAGVLTSVFMIIGISIMTFVKVDDTSTLFAVWASFFALFGFGVGGEYPLTASCAAETRFDWTEHAKLDDLERRRKRVDIDRAMTARRGETISLVFAMQGVGAFMGSVILMALIYFTGQGISDCDSLQTNSTGNNHDALGAIWRSFYFISMLMLLFLFTYRFLVVEESTTFREVQKRKRRRKERQKMLKKKRTCDVIWFYWPRLMGTAGNWFLWDIAFYGLKLFSGPIFEAINPGGNLYVTNGWLLFNNFWALLGYYAAAYVIDRKVIGRTRLQMFSLFMSAALFFITAIIFDIAQSGVIMFLFFASSFFGNFGANVTTYVMAAEAYPTELRSTCHGISAFAGKTGALLATIVFAYLDTKQIFYVTAATNLLGFLFTFVFSCDLTHVSLAEHDAQLELFLEGCPEQYKGLLNKKEHLTNFECWTGRHGAFDEMWASNYVAGQRSMHGL